MKIIGKSNYDLETVSDIVIAENIREGWGKLIIAAMREFMSESETYYPLLVEDNYELYKWEP